MNRIAQHRVDEAARAEAAADLRMVDRWEQQQREIMARDLEVGEDGLPKRLNRRMRARYHSSQLTGNDNNAPGADGGTPN